MRQSRQEVQAGQIAHFPARREVLLAIVKRMERQVVQGTVRHDQQMRRFGERRIW